MPVTDAAPETKRSALSGPVPVGVDAALYAGMLGCWLTNVFLGGYSGVDGDTVAYLDFSDLIRHHQWGYAFNASWFPLYPALLTLTRAVFHFRVQYDLLAARLATFLMGICFVVSSVVLAGCVRRLMLVRGFSSDSLVPARTLYAWAASFAFLVLTSDLTVLKPDALLSALMLFSLSALVFGFVSGSTTAFLMYGVLAGCAFWTKSFALPFFCMLTFFLMIANLRNRRVLIRLAVSVAVFIAIAGPYIWKISAGKGRLTIGDAGNLNSAWYVNGADRFNPVADLSVYRIGSAQGPLKHPAELLSVRPEITYYEKDRVYGAMPEWDDFSYWHDGLRPRFHLGQTLSAVKVNILLLGRLIPMRLQALFLILALGCWGFYLRKSSISDPVVLAVAGASLLSFVLYLVIHIEGRYVSFAVAILAVFFAACSTTERATVPHRSLHLAILLMTGVVLAGIFQRTVHEMKTSLAAGDNPGHGVYDFPVLSAGESLGSLYQRGTEVACFGHDACLGDALWARFAGVRIGAVIETTHGEVSPPLEQICWELNQNPNALDRLRQLNIKAIVGRFPDSPPCSESWRSLGKTNQFYYLPL